MSVNQEEYDKNLQDENIRIANRMAMERALRIEEAARKLVSDGGMVEIRLKIPNGEEENAFGIRETIYKEGEYNKQSYRFKKIATGDWNVYMIKRAELQNELMKPADKADQVKIADLNNRIYEYLALKYLGVPHTDFIRADWDDLKLAIDACNHITENANQSVDIMNMEISTKSAEELAKKIEGMKDRKIITNEFDAETVRLNSRTKPDNEKKEVESNSSYKKYYQYND